MSTGEDEPSSGLNGRLRPRKSTIPAPQSIKSTRKLDSKAPQERPKRTITPSKVFPNKLDDLTDKSDSPALQVLCPYCDKSFFSKKSVSKHIRTHLLSSKEENVFNCLFCNHTETYTNDIIRHMVDNHPNQYFACYDCHARFPSTTALAEHKLNVCEKQKLPYRNKLRQKSTPKKNQKAQNDHGRDDFEDDDKSFSGHFNGIVISCEIKPSHPNDPIDIEDNITTNLILPSSKNLGNSNVIEKNAIIVLDDLQWNKRIPPNFSFHNTDADQILSRLGVVHRSPRTGENNKKDWLKHIDDAHQKFEKCFDTSFYSKVASNVQENLAKFLDGSFNFNPDPENTIKTRKAKNIVAINTVEGFPILLASEQFSRNVFDGYLPRSIAPKHKWKWDNLESDKSLMSAEQIKRDSHTNNCIITLVSSLDIWTQLCMRRKFEEKFTVSPAEKRIEKQSTIGKELKEILESRELPTSSSQVVKYTGPQSQSRDNSDFPASLGLVPNAPKFDLKPAVLSGEWVRPRCYVCCACGAQTQDSKALSSHISTQHPNAQIQYYEIVGEVLLNSDILKHLYVPPSQLNNRTRPLRGFRECTKCRKGISLEDLHQHMLDCAGDTPTVRRKCRYRPFGVRKRRPRLPDNTLRKEMRKDIRHSRHNRKTLMRPRQKIRTEVGDAETIRKMLADLPAKRHRAIVNPLNPILRPRRKLNKQRSKLIIKKRQIDEILKKTQSTDLSKDTDNKIQQSQKPSSNTTEIPDNNVVHMPINKQKNSGTNNSLHKNRRKNFIAKRSETFTDSSDVPVQPTDSDNNKQIDQMSIDNTSERININDGSLNPKEHGNHHNGSNNRDYQHPGSSSQNSNSRDSFAPSQHVPLKHSIARLTASSETHDKSVQFHHLFLVQQECNDTNQHVPSGQRMLFENEAVVTKLDKPPLHFNHSEFIDAQAFQRNKFNKPRKGLNDCIAMLRNKLVEPSTSPLPGHVSVQCGSDEPLGPEPVVVGRRHSTAETNMVESAQRSLQMFYPNQNTCVDPIPLNYDSNTRVTRRSSTRHCSRRDKFVDVQANNDFMYWNQFYYNKQMLPAATGSYNIRESTRRRSVVSTEELLLQHAVNLELMTNSNRSFGTAADYQFPNVPPLPPTPQKTPKKNRSNSTAKTRSKNKEPRSRQKNNVDSNNSHETNLQNISDLDLPHVKKVNDTSFENTMVNNTDVTSITEKSDQCRSEGRVEEKTTDHNVDKIMLHSNNLPEEKRSVSASKNTPIIQCPKEYDIPPAHYNSRVNVAPTNFVPLDLTKDAIVEDSRHYGSEDRYCLVSYNNYETLDLSNKYASHATEKRLASDKVDFRLTYNSEPVVTRLTALPPEINAPDLPYGLPDTLPPIAHDHYVPVHFSRNRKESLSYERRRSYDRAFEMNMILDLPHPRGHRAKDEHDICLMIPRREGLDNEEPTDLSTWKKESNHYDEGLPVHLSGQIKENVVNDYYNADQRIPQYLEAVNQKNQETTRIIDDINVEIPDITEQIRSAHYNHAERIALRGSLLDTTTINYPEPIVNETQNMSVVTASSVNCDLPTSISSMKEDGARSSVNYLISEIPIIMSPKRTDETSSRNLMYQESGNRDYYYRDASPTYTMPQLNEKEVLSISKDDHFNVSKSQAFMLAESVSDTSAYTLSSASTTLKHSNNDTRKLFSEVEIPEELKLRKDKSPVATDSISSENENIEAIKDNYEKDSLDQDPETARKIAMLPKELVEILGNMPVDHRNQLLNVLPQYVASSTSPVLSQDAGNLRRDSISHSTMSSSPLHVSNQTDIDYKTSFTSGDGRPLLNNTSSSNTLQYIETSPTAVSSSILLTPPTPHQSDRHSNQSHENEEIKHVEYRRKSRISIDEDTPRNEVTPDNITAASHRQEVEYDEKNRIIDLTVDENLSNSPDVINDDAQSTNSKNYPSKYISSSIVTPKSKGLKVNSDKTASLRAVRIKTSSERQRTVLVDKMITKNINDSTLILTEEEKKNNFSTIINPMAIQQAEVSSTQHRTATKTFPAIQERIDTSPEELISTKTPIKNSIKDTNCDSNFTLLDKQNVVTSSLLKDTCELKDTIHSEIVCDAFKSDLSKSSYLLNVAKEVSPKTNQESNSTPQQNDVFNNKPMVDNEESLISKKLVMEDDDSEDDVSLAFIVKQKNRDLNAIRNDRISYEKENKKIDQRTDKLVPDQPKQVLFSCNKTVPADIGSGSQSKKCSDTLISTNNIESNDKLSKERVTIPKKKGRKGRRVNILGTTQYVEQQGQLCNTNEVDIEHDINKENNVSSEIVKNVDVMIDDPVRTKPSDLDNRTTSAHSVIPKEITKTTLHLSDDCLSSDNVKTGDQNSEAIYEAYKGVKDYLKEDSPDNNLNTCCTSDKDQPKQESNKNTPPSDNLYKIIENQLKDVEIPCSVNTSLPSKEVPHKIADVDDDIKNGEKTEMDDTNMTPLRRSRRGKSLFIESNTIANNSSAETTTEHRAPLTKKQLIFSKLLQDEENHNRPTILNTTAIYAKQVVETPSTIQYENQQENRSDNEVTEFDSGENKCNKRKKSPQAKRKCKKKKSLTDIPLTNEVMNSVHAVNGEVKSLESSNLINDDIVSIPNETSAKTPPLDSQNVPAPTAKAVAEPRPLPEKRKSTSPAREEISSISLPKKSKLNDETIEEIEKKVLEKEVNENKNTSTTVRNTTCYNKAIRRVRSKSVVVKSSGAELYDPYDIDLEDMVDNTEPFVRKEISQKNRLSTVKQSITMKSRKLSKTVPSAIIDISPSNVTTILDVHKVKKNEDTMNITTEYNNNNNNSRMDTKDGSSDSDESSKSDVPLKKYVEEKEKKLNEISPTPETVEKTAKDEIFIKTREKSKQGKKCKTQSVNNKESKVITNKTEIEEELRSEQFMESFGFFSERKPRKSNLLATKKITETFNLIENDDVFYSSKERVAKKSDNKKEDEVKKTKTFPKKVAKRGRKKRRRVKIKPSFCNICKKVFRRWDNYVRHLLSLYHISRLCEIELKVKTVLIEEEPNYLLAYRQQLNRLKVLQNKIAKRKKNCLSTADIVLPTLEQMLEDVRRTIREQQLSRRSLSRDEALFIDCCEMLKESHNGDGTTVRRRQCNSFNCAQACQEELALLEKSILDDRCDIKGDEEMDSLAAKKILESEEVRNLENDLITNLKEANGITGPLTGIQIEPSSTFTNSVMESHALLSNYEVIDDSAKTKNKRHEVKEKMYPDVVENIDMFEDKFDKIKRKCRSQAAAAKQIQTHVESNPRYKNRKKSEKKKAINRRGYNNTVPTKAALKGFDGIKVSINTSDIKLPANITPVEKVHRKKRKNGSKKRRDRTNSEKSIHREGESTEKSSTQKKLDVYEFMDTEDTEVFEFRPSTLMERFKSINNKDLPSTSKAANEVECDNTSESGSDGDDFVYMSDDYVCSDDETENSLLSCELGNVKVNNEPNKASTLIKRKETTEKIAVMGKIFKHNAVRTEKKSPKNRESVKPKANLDQLFDSLLEDEPNMSSSVINDDMPAEKEEAPPSRVYLSLSPQKDDLSRFGKSGKRYDQALSITSETGLCQKYSTPSPTLHPSLSSFSVRRKSTTPPKMDIATYPPSTSDPQVSSPVKHYDDLKKSETIKEYDAPKIIHTKRYEPFLSDGATAAKTDNTFRRRSDDYNYDKKKSREDLYKDKNEKKKKEGRKLETIDLIDESFDEITSEDAGVARQRARRKCTVGKQNVLAETWSSESEPDGAPPRPNSAESVVAIGGRKKKGKKKYEQSSGSRKAARPISVKKVEYESVHRAGSGGQARPRSPPYYWSEGDDEQDLPQQHGWIVGDSHKKLVTMLAHAKGRKRSGDEKRNLLE